MSNSIDQHSDQLRMPIKAILLGIVILLARFKLPPYTEKLITKKRSQCQALKNI